MTEEQKKALEKMDYPVDKLNSLLEKLNGLSSAELITGSGPLADALTVCGMYGASPQSSCTKYIEELRTLCGEYVELHRVITSGGNAAYSTMAQIMALTTAINLLVRCAYSVYKRISVLGCGRIMLNYRESYYIPTIEQWECARHFIADDTVRKQLDELMGKVDKNSITKEIWHCGD